MPQSIYDNGGMVGVTLDFGDTDTYGGSPGVPANLQYVGGKVNGRLGSTSDYSYLDPTDNDELTGGISNVLAAGDLVVTAFATNPDDTGEISYRLTGFTELANIYVADTERVQIQVGYRFAQAGDTSADYTITGGSDDIDQGYAYAVHVWRGVDPSTPIDVVTQTDTFTNTAIPNPPSITPVTDGAVVIAIGGNGHNRGLTTFTSSDLSNFISDTGDDTHDATIGMGSIAWTGGAVDPAAFSWSGSNSSLFAAAAVTLALRPYTVPAVTTREESIPVLEDNFEVFSGWTEIVSGAFTQSSTRSFNGAYSGYRDVASSGGYKLLSEPISRPYRMEYRIWTDDPNRTGTGDRVGILNSSLEGYGTRVFTTVTGAEKYNGAYNSGLTTISTSSVSKPQQEWYKTVFEANADDTFTTTIYEEDGTLVGSHTTAADTTYTGTFDRVYIGGGYPYYIDDISVYGTATKPLNKKNSGIWSLASVLETVSSRLTFVGSTTFTNPNTANPQFTIDFSSISGVSVNPGDLVFVIGGSGATFSLITSGYTVLADNIFGDDTVDTKLFVAYKYVTNDTSVTIDMSGSDAGTAVALYVWRNVGSVTAETATGTNTGEWNPPSVTAIADNSVVFSAGTSVSATTSYTAVPPSGYSANVVTAEQLYGSSPYGANIGIATKDTRINTDDSEDPGIWTGVSTSTSVGWAAITVALGPA